MDERFELLGPTGSITGVRTTPVYRRSSSNIPNEAGAMEVDKQEQSGILSVRPSPSHMTIERPAASSFSMVPYGARTFPLYDSAFALLPEHASDLSAVSGSITSISNGSGDVFDELSALIKRKSVEIALKAQFMTVTEKKDMVDNVMKMLPGSKSLSTVVTLQANTDGVLSIHVVDGTQTSMQEYTRTMVSAMSDESAPCIWSVNVFMVIQLVYVLFTGRNCYTPTAGFLDEFAKVQSKYRTALGLAVKLVEAPLDVEFVCRELASTIHQKLNFTLVHIQSIRNRDDRVPMLTTAILAGIHFPEAKRISKRRELAYAKQVAAMALNAVKQGEEMMEQLREEYEAD